MSGHIAVHIALAYPLQCSSQELLTISRTFYIAFPTLDIGILRIGKLFLTFCNESSAINGIQFFLMVQGDTCYIDCLEPFFDFFFSVFALSFADIYKQFCF